VPGCALAPTTSPVVGNGEDVLAGRRRNDLLCLCRNGILDRGLDGVPFAVGAFRRLLSRTVEVGTSTAVGVPFTSLLHPANSTTTTK